MEIKKIIIIAVSVLAIISLLSMFVIMHYIDKYVGPKEKIYYDNEKISADFDSYFTKSYIEIGNNHIKFGYFSGSKTIYEFDESNSKMVSINYNVLVKDGRFKLVLILPDKEVILLCEGSDKAKNEIEIPKGISKIKMVGIKAKGEVNITIQ